MQKMVLFDFDGVLADTEEFCFKIHKKVNQDLTWEKWQDFCLGSFIDNMNSKHADGSHKIPQDFYEKYQEEIEKIEIKKELRELIVQLAREYILVIVSSTNTKYIKSFLEKEGLEKYFSGILGADVHKDKSIKINILLEKYKINTKNSVFITDTVGDILEADKSGVVSIGVTWGLHDKGILQRGNPTIVVDDPRDLLEAIKSVLK